MLSGCSFSTARFFDEGTDGVRLYFGVELTLMVRLDFGLVQESRGDSGHTPSLFEIESQVSG